MSIRYAIRATYGTADNPPVEYDFDLIVIGSRPRRPTGRDPGGQARQARRDRREGAGRWRLGQLGDDPVEDAARGDRLSDRAQPALDVRRELPREAGDHRRRPPPPHAARHQPRGGRRPQPADAKPCAPGRGRGRLRRRAHDPRRRAPVHHRVRRHRLRHHACPAGRGRLRRADRPRLQRHRPARADTRLGARRRRRRGRHRVRVDVRGARLEGHGGREAREAARLLRQRDRRGPPLPPARPRRRAPLRRGGHRRRAPRGRHAHHARERQARRRRRRALRGRPPGRDRHARARRTPGSRPTDADASPSAPTSARRSRTSSPPAT